MNRWQFGVGLLLCVAVLCAALCCCRAEAAASQLFTGLSGSYYYYASCPVVDGTTTYYYYCRNKTSGVIRDHVYLKRNVNGTWQSEQLMLSPSTSGWDSIHCCDPNVVRGSFLYNGTTYIYALFYLGCDQTDNNHNQIGVAFSNSLQGPWVKWSGNPLITSSSTTEWGVGQPSATAVNGGQILLFYTKGTATYTSVYRRSCDLSNMASPSIGTEGEIPKAGLTLRDGNPEYCLSNADFVYDGSRDRFFMIRPRFPFDTTSPNYVETEEQIASTAGSTIWNCSGTWDVAGNITATYTGQARNHNPAIARTVWGGLVSSSAINCVFSNCPLGGNWWNYRLWKAPGTLSGTPPVITW